MTTEAARIEPLIAPGRDAEPSNESILIITADRAAANYWRDVWAYRELLYFLAWRDLAVRYKQTAIGVAWAVLRPALTMLVFVAFRRMARVPSTDVPDPLLVFAAVLPWQFFASALAEASNSLIGNSNLISKVYFPRLIVPLASVVTSLADFGVTLGLLAALMAWYGFAPSATILALPLLTLHVFALSLGAGLLLAALNVKYRDFRYVVPFIVQFGLFVSPIAFRSSDVPERWRTVLALNPMTGVLDAFRWSILGGKSSVDGTAMWASVIGTLLLLTAGVRYFRRVERTVADVI